MNLYRKFFISGLLAFGCLSGGWAQMASPAAAAAEPKAALSGALKIVYGEKAVQLTAAEFAALPHVTVKVFNPKAKAEQSYSGVLLWDLLTRVGVAEIAHGKVNRHYIALQGADGFVSVLALGEIAPKLHDTVAILADAVDGKPLGAPASYALVNSADKAPERWVRNVVAIRLQAAE